MNIRDKNIKKAHFWAKILQKLPGVKAVFLSGSLATKTDTKHSDIDFFIVAYDKQIFTARFFVNLVLKSCGQLAKPQNHAGKICPNHFVSDCFLELTEKNNYTARMFSQNIPLADRGNVWNAFQANNGWIKNFGYEWTIKPSQKKSADKNTSINFFEKQLEQVLKKIQILKIKNNKNFQSSEKIVLTDSELRFHPVLKSKIKNQPTCLSNQ